MARKRPGRKGSVKKGPTEVRSFGLVSDRNKRRYVERSVSGFLDKIYKRAKSISISEQDRKKIESLVQLGSTRALTTEEQLRLFDLGGPYHMKHVARSRTYYASIIENIASGVQFRGKEKVVSFGSGNGVVEIFLSKSICPGGQFTLVDLSPRMTRSGKQLAKEEGVGGKFRFLVEPMENTTLPDHSQTIGIILDALSISKNPRQVLLEMRRVLKKDGSAVLVLGDFNPNPERLLEENGFVLVHKFPNKGSGVGRSLSKYTLIAKLKGP